MLVTKIVPKKGLEDIYELVTDKKELLEEEIRKEFEKRAEELDKILANVTEEVTEEVPDPVEESEHVEQEFNNNTIF